MKVTRKKYLEYLESRLRQIEYLEEAYAGKDEDGRLYFTFSPDAHADKMTNFLELCRQKDYIMQELYSCNVGIEINIENDDEATLMFRSFADGEKSTLKLAERELSGNGKT